MKQPFLYINWHEDRGETNDLSKSNPEKLKEMMKEWEIFKKKTGVIQFNQGEPVLYSKAH